MTDPQIVQVELDKIQVPELRITSQVEDDTMAELVESVRQNGVMQPITVSRQGEKLVLVDGLHRLVAAQTVGLLTIPAIITQESEAELMLKNLYLNRQRGRSNPAQEAEVVRYLEEESHLSLGEIVSRTGIARDRIRELLEISHLPREVLDLVAARKLGITHAQELLKLRTDSDKVQVAADAAQWAYTRDQVSFRVRELLQPQAALQPGQYTFTAVGAPVRVPLLCALCAVDLGDSKSYLWACGDCIACLSEACRLLRSQGACRIPPPAPPPPPRWVLTDTGWERGP